MPYAKLARSELQVYWTSNIPGDDLSVMWTNPKPVVLMMHAILLSTDWRRQQLTDRFLSHSCYMIAFDGVTNGKTKCPNYVSSGLASQHDAWAEAAMIALFAQQLNLPPFHIFAEQIIAITASLRFAMLFPDQCLSLTLVGVPPPTDEQWVLEGYMQAVVSWVHANDLESLEEAQAALAYFYFSTYDSNPQTTICLTDEEMDRLIEHFQMNHNPADSARGLLGVGITVRTRQPLQPKELALVKQPVLIIQGDSSPVHTLTPAYELQSQLVNASGGAQLDIIPGGPDCVAVPARFAPEVNRSFATFLFSLSADVSARAGRCTVDAADMRRALALVASLAGDPSMAQRDPERMWSFCRMPPDARELVETFFIPTYIKAAKAGKTLLAPDGRPIRKYSERHEKTIVSSMKQVRRSSVVSRKTVQGQS